jgi:hypothetical protein
MDLLENMLKSGILAPEYLLCPYIQDHGGLSLTEKKTVYPT